MKDQETIATYADCLPCRFCQQRPRVGNFRVDDDGYSGVECHGYGDHSIVVHADSEHQAVKFWNGMMSQ